MYRLQWGLNKVILVKMCDQLKSPRMQNTHFDTYMCVLLLLMFYYSFLDRGWGVWGGVWTLLGSLADDWL